MSEQISLWALFFIVFIGTVWITIMAWLKRIESLLRDKDKTDSEDSTTSKTG